MAKYSGILQGKVRGKIGGIVFTELAGVGTVGREYIANPSNPRTSAQQERRVKLSNLINIYRQSRKWMHSAFETKKPGQSDYNRFVSLNFNTSPIALTKQEAAAGAAVIAQYTISEGSLQSIALNEVSERQYRTNIVLGALVISTSTTVAEFSQAVISNNPHIMEGMQLSFISYQQSLDPVSGFPRLVCNAYEVTLNSNNSDSLDSYLPVRFAAASQGDDVQYLATGPTLADGAFAYILSNRISGKIMVSTQRLQLVGNSIYRQYSAASQQSLAEQSYGAGSDTFLAPGSSQQQAADRVQGIESIQGWTIGGVSSSIAVALSEQTIYGKMLAPAENFERFEVVAENGIATAAETLQMDENGEFSATFGTVSPTVYVTAFKATVDGVTYTAEFTVPSGGGSGLE